MRGVGAGRRARVRPASLPGALEVRDEALPAGPLDHLHQLPAVLAPLVEDLLGRMHDERHRRVLPGLHGAHPIGARGASRSWRRRGPHGRRPPRRARGRGGVYREAVPDLLDPRVRLHVVTGKGGTGKTTVAGALALALARQGRRVLLCEVEGRQGLARLFDRDPLGFEPTTLVPVPGGELLGSAIDAKGALLEYLEVFYRLGRAGRTLERIGAVDFATTIAPGLRDVLLTGKVYDAVRTRQGSRRGDTPYLYDHVVLDAPPTGRIGNFLNVNAVGAGLAKVGPIHSQAESVMKVLRSSATAVHLVTLLEDMPVQETADAVAELRGLGLPLGRLVRQPGPPAAAGRATLLRRARDPGRRGTRRAGRRPRRPGRRRPRPRGEGGGAARRDPRPRPAGGPRGRAAREVAALGLPVIELPQLQGGRSGLDDGGVHELAEELA